jgi:malonyl CoA-acyl carrier protein transacylase/thioesterase domain-containing protein
MAAFHINTLRRIQPHGPYFLGGLCAGGLIAYEMARQLVRDGERVALVALIDAADVEAIEVPHRQAKLRFERLASTFEEGKDRSAVRQSLNIVDAVLRKAWNFTRYQVECRVTAARDLTKMRLFQFCLNLGLRIPSPLQGITVRTAYGFAKRRYRPSTPFDGELLLLRAMNGVEEDEAYQYRYIDPLLGWGPRATRGVRTFDIPGGHSSMLQEPNVQVLAKDLQAYLDEVQNVSRPSDASSLRASRGDEAATTARDATSQDMDKTPESKPPTSSRATHLLVVSADTREALKEAAGRLAEHVETLEVEDLPDLGSTLAMTRRTTSSWRRAVIAGNPDEANTRLRAEKGKGVWDSQEPVRHRGVAFILAGVGEHTPGAGRGLYEREPVFQTAADRCAEILQPLIGFDIRELMFTEHAASGNWLRNGGGAVIRETRLAQPAAFVLDWALSQMWITWGIKPAAVLGYSVGEYVAATLSGILQLEDALTLVARRAQWIEESAQPGAMLAVSLDEAKLLPRIGKNLWLAAVNSPQTTVVGGGAEAVQQLEEELKEAGVATRRVASDQGSHTPLLDPVKPWLARLAGKIHQNPPRIPMLSNVTGSWLSATESIDAEYWCRHMCGTLRFQDAIGELLQVPEQIILEVGPGAGLGSMVRQHPRFEREQMGRVLGSLPGIWERATDQEYVASALGRLWVEGASVDWEAYHARDDRRRLALPAEPVAAEFQPNDPVETPSSSIATPLGDLFRSQR